MATTTNYGWTTPDDTDLVKDGAAAIRTLGSSVDTTTKALNPSTTLGDVEYRSSTANTNTRLGIGTTGQVLTVAGGVPSWATPAGGGMDLLSTTTLTGASVSLSSIPQTYKNLQLIVRNFLPATDAGYLTLRVNGDSTANRYRVVRSNSANNAGDDALTFDRTDWLGQYVDNSVSEGLQIFTIFDYTNTTTWKYHSLFAMGNNYTTSTSVSVSNGVGIYNQTGAITSLDLQPNTGNFTSGTALLYGVK
jgi:hypothetical protein